MTNIWPLCLKCRKHYIPVPTLRGCPWCSGYIDPSLANETWRERAARRKREHRADLKNLGYPTSHL